MGRAATTYKITGKRTIKEVRDIVRQNSLTEDMDAGKRWCEFLERKGKPIYQAKRGDTLFYPDGRTMAKVDDDGAVTFFGGEFIYPTIADEIYHLLVYVRDMETEDETLKKIQRHIDRSTSIGGWVRERYYSRFYEGEDEQ